MLFKSIQEKFETISEELLIIRFIKHRSLDIANQISEKGSYYRIDAIDQFSLNSKIKSSLSAIFSMEFFEEI